MFLVCVSEVVCGIIWFMLVVIILLFGLNIIVLNGLLLVCLMFSCDSLIVSVILVLLFGY